MVPSADSLRQSDAPGGGFEQDLRHAEAERVADRLLGSALDAIHHGLAVDALRLHVGILARAVGADPGTVDVVTRSDPLAKMRFVALRIAGASARGAPYSIARTTIVGFDTFPWQAAAGALGLAAMRGLESRLGPGIELGAVQEDVGAARGHVTRLGGAPGGRETVRPGDILYAEVAIAGDPSGATGKSGPVKGVTPSEPGAPTGLAVGTESVLIGDMYRVTADGAECLTMLARRLWL